MNEEAYRAHWERATKLGRAEFLVLPTRRLSYGDICADVRRICALYDAKGVTAGDRIVICSEQDYAVVAAFMAALLHGVVATNLAPGTKGTRGRAVIEDLDAVLLITDADIAEDWGADCATVLTAGRAKRRLGGLRKADTWPFAEDAPAGVEPRLPPADDALAYILYTSGSVSAPSGVMITRRNLVANMTSVAEVTDLQEGDRSFVDLPMGHADGLLQGPVLAFGTGSAVIRAGGFQLPRLEEWLNTIRRERCTHVLAVPYIWSMIDKFGAHDDYFDDPELKLLSSTAARLDPALGERFEARFGRVLANEYGMTETVYAAFHAGDRPGMGVPGTIGLPVHNAARLGALDGTGPAENGAREGELQLSGDNISPGYWKNPERTAAVRTADGWFRTGDLVALRADGSYELRGRITSMINSGGVRIHPDEINEALESHPDVLLAVTVGISDPDWGELPVTAVEVETDIAETALIEYARGRLETSKVPKRIVAMDPIPRGDSGKPKLAEIAERLAAAGTVPEAGSGAPSADRAVLDQVIALAGEAFICDPATLSASSTQDDVIGWDSFSQLRLFLAVEEHWSVRLPTNKLAAIRTLGDVVEALKPLV